MRCPKCGKGIDQYVNVLKDDCPNCHFHLSFTTRDYSTWDSEQVSKGIMLVRKANHIIGLAFTIAVPIIIVLLIWLMNAGFLHFGLPKTLRIINFMTIIILVVGISILITLFALALFKKISQIPKKAFICGLILILLSIIIKFTLTEVGFFKIDYTYKEYIELGSEKIPSLYKVVGKRDIALSNEDKNYYDEDINVTYDSIYISYNNLQDGDLQLYSEYLKNKGYSKIKIKIEDGEKELLIKDGDNNTCYFISLDTTITYFVSKERCTEIFNKKMIVE